MSNNQNQSNFDVWKAIIGFLGLIIGAALGYLGTRASADAQIQAAKENANAQITAVWIQVYGPIFTTQTAEALHPPQTNLAPTEFFTVDPDTVPTSTPNPNPTAEDQLIQLIDGYYTCINSANPLSDYDYEGCWEMLSNRPGEFQSNLDKGEFIAFWKKYMITYELYYCQKSSQKLVDAKYSLYDRSDLSFPIGDGKVFYLEFEFALDTSGWRITGADDSINTIGSYCESQPRIERMTLTP
jgi:hypothetical protein